jgi:hypothetical protein
MRRRQFDVETTVAAARAAGWAVSVVGFSCEEEFLGHG